MSQLNAATHLHESYSQLKSELAKVIVGQHDVIEQLLMALFAGGHCLLVGVPGLAKTLTIRTLASTLSLKFSRIQFTPDLMPSDITGTEIMQEDRASGERSFRFMPGPVFANVVLADEINRTPPKTQAALLEAMEERQVTTAGAQHKLPEPFFVLATQNPIEQEGTYPLPEAQLDRFMFQVKVGYPSEDEELQVVQQTGREAEGLSEILAADEILSLRSVVRDVPVAEHVASYALRLVRSTRKDQKHSPDFINQYVQWGAGPRASQHLVLGAKSRAILQGRHCVTCDDVRAVAPPALRHRVKASFRADAEGITVDDLIQRLIDEVPEVKEGSGGDSSEVFRSADAG